MGGLGAQEQLLRLALMAKRPKALRLDPKPDQLIQAIAASTELGRKIRLPHSLFVLPEAEQALRQPTGEARCQVELEARGRGRVESLAVATRRLGEPALDAEDVRFVVPEQHFAAPGILVLPHRPKLVEIDRSV